MQSVWLHYRVWWERKRGEMWVTRCRTAKTFSRLCDECEKEGGRGRSIQMWNISKTKARKSITRFFKYISSLPLLPLPVLCPYFLRNSVTQIPEQEKLMVWPNNIMEITYDFGGKESFFVTAEDVSERRSIIYMYGTCFNILSPCLSKGIKLKQAGGGFQEERFCWMCEWFPFTLFTPTTNPISSNQIQCLH